MDEQDLDEDGEPESFYVDACVRLLAAVITTAARDARRGSLEAIDFLERAEVPLADVQPEPRIFLGRRSQEEIRESERHERLDTQSSRWP